MRIVIEIDDELLEVAAAELGTGTTPDTVNEALRQIAARTARARAVLEEGFSLAAQTWATPE